MSRKHFRALAEAIAGINDEGDRIHTAQLIGVVCAECNDRFNWATWYSACNVDRSKV